MPERLRGRTAIVTGAGSGIGHAAAVLFAGEGARVLAVDRPGVVQQFDTAAIEPFAADIAAPDAPERIAAEVAARFGGLDILFNNAGIYRKASVADTSDTLWDETHDVTLKAGFRLARGLISLLAASSAGRIIWTASVAADRPVIHQAAYSSAKAAILALSRAFALELGPLGITSNAIQPGLVATGMTQGVVDPAREAQWSAQAPLGRIGAPDDIARVALFFASDDSGFVTGQSLVVDGGMFVAA